MASGSGNTDALIQIRLLTKQEQYAVPDCPYSVPITIDLASLNTLINDLLRETNENIKSNIEFDFLVTGELLRVNLSEHLKERNISSESTVDIEYIERYSPPQPQDCLLHDDWVSAVDVRERWILTGCYDNTIHLWSTKGKHKLTIPGHTAPVKAVGWVQLDSENGIFVSGSHDQTAMLWQWRVNDNAVQCVTALRGHERGIECIRVDPSGKTVASSGWDCLVKIWSTKLENDPVQEEGEPSSKRIKIEANKVRTPKITLQGHREAVGGLTWIDPGTVISGSWDHTIRLWDIELGGLQREIAGNKAFFDIDYSPLSRQIVAASADRHVRIYDPRSKEGSVVKCTYTSHSLWVQTVRWSDKMEHFFISGSHDGQAKLWDVRGPQAPLYDLGGHEDKILCSDWHNNVIVTGGADNTVRIFKSDVKTIKTELLDGQK